MGLSDWYTVKSPQQKAPRQKQFFIINTQPMCTCVSAFRYAKFLTTLGNKIHISVSGGPNDLERALRRQFYNTSPKKTTLFEMLKTLLIFIAG